MGSQWVASDATLWFVLLESVRFPSISKGCIEDSIDLLYLFLKSLNVKNVDLLQHYMPTYKFVIHENKILQQKVPADGFKGPSYMVSNFYVDINQFSSISLPIDSNVRKPVDNTTATQAIKDTIGDKSTQTRFWALNGGLVIVARNATPNAGKIEIDIPPKYGLINGGHTQLAIKNALKEHGAANVLVRVEVISGKFNDNEIAAIAEARNTSKDVKGMSVAWKQGKFKELRSKLTDSVDKRIDWTENLVESYGEGTKAVCSGSQFISLIMLFNVLEYDSNKAPITYVTGPGGAFTKWCADPKKYAFLNHIAKDIINLHEEILATFHVDHGVDGLLNTRWGGKPVFTKPKLCPPTPFEERERKRKMDEGILKPILSAFRGLLDIDETKGTVQWTANPIETWNENKTTIMTQVKTAIIQSSTVYEFRKNRMVWDMCAMIVANNKIGSPGTKVTY